MPLEESTLRVYVDSKKYKSLGIMKYLNKIKV